MEWRAFASQRTEASVKLFQAPKETLGDLDAEAAATVIATAADVALVVNAQGIIQDLAFPRAELASEFADAADWIGRSWADMLIEESRPKVRALLDEATGTTTSRWRQLNHRSGSGAEFPILYSVVKIGTNDRFVAVGRDLRTLATLQQRLVEAQMSMERDYSRLRHVETRYRILFQTSAEPVLVVDATTDKVVEANPAATRLFGDSVGRMIGSAFPQIFPPKACRRCAPCRHRCEPGSASRICAFASATRTRNSLFRRRCSVRRRPRSISYGSRRLTSGRAAAAVRRQRAFRQICAQRAGRVRLDRCRGAYSVSQHRVPADGAAHYRRPAARRGT